MQTVDDARGASGCGSEGRGGGASGWAGRWGAWILGRVSRVGVGGRLLCTVLGDLRRGRWRMESVNVVDWR